MRRSRLLRHEQDLATPLRGDLTYFAEFWQRVHTRSPVRRASEREFVRPVGILNLDRHGNIRIAMADKPRDPSLAELNGAGVTAWADHSALRSVEHPGAAEVRATLRRELSHGERNEAQRQHGHG